MLWLALYNGIFVSPMIAITAAVYFGLTTAEKAEGWRTQHLEMLHLVAGRSTLSPTARGSVRGCKAERWLSAIWCPDKHPACRAARRQLGLSRYETASNPPQVRAGMVRQDQDRIGGRKGEKDEDDETWDGGRTRGKGCGVHDKVLVDSAEEVRQRSRAPSSTSGRVVAMPGGFGRHRAGPQRGVLCGYVECAVVPGTSPSRRLERLRRCQRGYKHLAIAERGERRSPRSIWAGSKRSRLCRSFTGGTGWARNLAVRD